MIDLNNQTLISVMTALASFRVYLEIIGFPWHKLPLTKVVGSEKAQGIHRYGLIMSIGFLLFSIPQLLFGF